MTNDYAALVAMLDQAAADLQAEIDAAIDRHGLLARTADSLRTEAEQVWHPGTRVLDDIDPGTRWVYVPDSGWSITQEPTIHADLPLPAQLIAAQQDATTAQDERDLWDDIATALYARSDAVFSRDDPAGRAYRAARNGDTDGARKWLA